MPMKLKPLGNRVVIKRSQAKTTKGGILLPESAQEKPKEGEVVSVGPGKVDEKGNMMKIELEVGDRVLFSSYAGTECKTDSEDDYLIVTEDDILAVLT